MSTSKALSLLKRESFFDDAFFKDAWEDFDTAMKSVLTKFEEKRDYSTRTLCTDVYRNVRSSNIDKDLYASQALQVTEKDGKFQCVMDVKDFNPNELQVKVVDDKVVVEGKFEKTSEDGKSMSSKSFYKEFTLPKSAELDAVSTALSKDGVLTVKAPKKEGGAITAAPSGAVQQSSTSSSVQESSSSSVVKDGTQSSQTSQVSSSVKKSSFSSTTQSSFSSSTKISSSSNTIQESSSAVEDMGKDMKDRLVFTHDTVNVKLPGENK